MFIILGSTSFLPSVPKIISINFNIFEPKNLNQGLKGEGEGQGGFLCVLSAFLVFLSFSIYAQYEKAIELIK